MDSYLDIAQHVLEEAKCPLSAQEILTRAYLSKIVPSHLFGRTQHKTLQARLSEDILIRRERSAFFRTEPGRFFLREFLADTSLPEKYRTPIVARRRQRDLHKDNLLSFQLSDVFEFSRKEGCIDTFHVLNLIESNKFHYVKKNERANPSNAVVWSFVIVSRKTSILSYRLGRYRESRDAFRQKRSIGFFSPISEDDRTLFDIEDHGIVSSGVRATFWDLDIPFNLMQESEYRARSLLICFLLHKEQKIWSNILSVIKFDCPDWFEPMKRRLAINDLQWLDLRAPPNYLEDFDPWSRRVLMHIENMMSNSDDQKCL